MGSIGQKMRSRGQTGRLIVEGYTDVISLYAKGVQNVVASLGTAPYYGPACLLGRFTKHVTIAFDGDQAGERATLRGCSS